MSRLLFFLLSISKLNASRKESLKSFYLLAVFIVVLLPSLQPSVALSSPDLSSLAPVNDNLPPSISLNTHNLFPYGSYQQDGDFSGIAVDRLECALADIGVALKLHVVPWARAEAEVFQGKVDGFFAASQNEKRDLNGVKSTQIAEQSWQWFLLAGNNWEPEKEAFQSSALVSSFIGANMQRYLEEHHYRLAHPPVTTEALATMLVSKRIDAALANNRVMSAILKKKYPEVEVKTFLLKEKPLYVYFGNHFIQKYPLFLPVFNAAVESCMPNDLLPD